MPYFKGMSEPRIVCAAIRLGAEIIVGARHYDAVMIMQLKSRRAFGDNSEWRTADQGFIDQHCNFLTREEAWAIALKHGQIVNDPDWCNGSLHSEHLY